MGLPELTIAFKEIIRKQMPEVSTGKVLMLLKDKAIKGKYTYFSEEDVAEKYEPANLKYITDCFIGNKQDIRVNGSLEERRFSPEKITVVAYDKAAQIDTVLKGLETEIFDFLCCPYATEEDNLKIVDFIKKSQTNYKSFAILATSKPNNNENILEFEVGDFEDNSIKYTDAKLLPRIAGLCAGTPLEQSITYAILDELESVPTKDNDSVNALIDSGKITLINKGGKVRIARGVTSFTKIDDGKGRTFKTIEQVRLYKYIDNTLSAVINDVYVGKVKNSYKNKLVLITEIKAFLKELSKRDLLHSDYDVDINIPRQRTYLKEMGINVKVMTEEEIKIADTGEQVFLKLTIRPIGSMEDFNIEVEV